MPIWMSCRIYCKTEFRYSESHKPQFQGYDIFNSFVLILYNGHQREMQSNTILSNSKIFLLEFQKPGSSTLPSVSLKNVIQLIFKQIKNYNGEFTTLWDRLFYGWAPIFLRNFSFLLMYMNCLSSPSSLPKLLRD